MPVEIKDFTEALAQREGRELMPTGMSAEQLREVETAVRERSVFSARVTNAEFLQRVSNVTDQIIKGELGENKARLLLGQYLDSIEYHARPGTEGTIQDLRTDARLNLIVRTQVNMAYGYGKWRGRQVQSVLDEYPCLEFYRAFDRKEPRDWPARWLEAGGQFYEGDSDYPEGRMIAPQNDLIWVALSAFGTPYAPFDYNSGMDTELVSRAEAIALGAWTENDRVYPAQRGFETDAAASVRDLSPEMAQVLEETLGDGYDLSDGIIQRANEEAEVRAYIRTGPHGQPVEVREHTRHYDPTETPEFKAWFGDSKVVDKDGKPLVVYHGTRSAGFDSFKIKDKSTGRPTADIGAWFSAPSKSGASYDEGNAEYIADVFAGEGEGELGRSYDNYPSGAAHYPSFLSIKNPKEFDSWDSLASHMIKIGGGDVAIGGPTYRKILMRDGYDGIVVRDSTTDGNVFRDDWVAFHPTQIKSAIGNRGTWSKTDPSIVNELPDCVLQRANEMGIRQLENSMVIEEVFA
jgi:hypothetical protein